jgi:SAM-dependent methyltransferase
MTTSSNPRFDPADLNRNLHECNMLHGAAGSLNPRPPGLHNWVIQFGKKLMRRSLSWYTRPLHQFQGAVTRTLNNLAQAAAESREAAADSKRLEQAWRQNIPAFLDAISTVNAFHHDLSTLRRDFEQGLQSMPQMSRKFEEEFAQLRMLIRETRENITPTWAGIEFRRREMPGYEGKYRECTAILDRYPVPLEAMRPKVIALEKVASARKLGLRLNLGCGHIPLGDYINVDRRELPGVDVVAEVGDLPFEKATVEEIFSAHLLDHFPQELLSRCLLPVWHALLKPGGVFKAIVSDGDAMLSAVSAGTYSFSDFRDVLFGAQDYDANFHFNLFTPDTLSVTLKDAGFTKVSVSVRARRNGKCFECEVSAEKPVPIADESALGSR